jgi:alpha-mannosidase
MRKIAMGELSNVANVSGSHVQTLVERIECQLELAGRLCAWHPEKASAWQKLIAKARGIAAAAIQRGGIDAIRSAVSECEGVLQPLGPAAKKYTIYCAGHAHIDMNWMWSWPETVAVTHDTFQTVIRLMEEFPEFHFSQSQASVYRIIEEHNPQLLKSIAEKVKSGQWEVTASHWVEGDKNMVSGDALVRHLLVTRKYMAQLFDLKPEDVEIDWSPDTFGHPFTMPMYLARGGVKYHYLHRPGSFRPEAFWWEGPDGSRVLVRNDQKRGYNGMLQPDRNMMNSLYDFNHDTGLPYTLFMYGVGDHGGGPTRRDLLRGREMATWPIFPNVKLATVAEFFRRLEADGAKLPVIKDELNTEVAGCYTTQTLIKRSNRIAENRLMDAEAVSTLADKLAGVPYPSAKLEGAWRDTLFNHFHDILPGSNVHDSRTWAHGLFQKTIRLWACGRSRHRSTRSRSPAKSRQAICRRRGRSPRWGLASASHPTAGC